MASLQIGYEHGSAFIIVLSVWPVQSFFTSPLLMLYLYLNVSETGGSDDEFGNGSEKTCACTIM